MCVREGSTMKSEDIAVAARLKQLDYIKSMLLAPTQKTIDRVITSFDNEYKGTVLYWASVHGDSLIVDKLSSLGASVNQGNAYGHTPLHAAADMGHTDVVSILIHRGARLDAQNQSHQTALHLAAYRGYTEIVKLLIQAGANSNLKNKLNRTPLQEAKAMKRQEIVALLENVTTQFCQGLPEAEVVVSMPRSANNSPPLPQRPPRPASHEEPLLNNNSIMSPYTSPSGYTLANQHMRQCRRLPSSHESLTSFTSLEPEPLTLNVATRTNSYPPYAGRVVAPPSYTVYPPAYTSLEIPAQYWSTSPHLAAAIITPQSYYVYRPQP